MEEKNCTKSQRKFELLKTELGQVLGSKDLAAFLGLDEATVRKYYQDLGGMRVGAKYLFFEKEVQRAIQKRTNMDWSDTQERQTNGEEVQDKAGSPELGSRPEKKVRGKLEDPFGIFSRPVGK